MAEHWRLKEEYSYSDMVEDEEYNNPYRPGYPFPRGEGLPYLYQTSTGAAIGDAISRT